MLKVVILQTIFAWFLATATYQIGSRIEKRSTKTGELLGVVKVAAEHTTSCCFYGKDLNKLFITSSGDGLTGEFDGCIFTCDVDENGCETDFVDM